MSNTSSLQGKTIRPGNLSGYSYYYSNRELPRPNRTATTAKTSARPKSHRKFFVVAAIVLVFVGIGYSRQSSGDTAKVASVAQPSEQSAPQPTPVTKKTAAAATTGKVNRCAGNDLDKLIKVDISDKHLWACEGGKTVHDAAVITGKEGYAATLTPRGEYKVYGKQKETTLTGSDETGSWNRPVHYWMPFLDNEHGTYGFHDATWRPASEFGNVDPVTGDASHGCVELPLDSQAWLYEWAPVGTVLRVES